TLEILGHRSDSVVAPPHPRALPRRPAQSSAPTGATKSPVLGLRASERVSAGHFRPFPAVWRSLPCFSQSLTFKNADQAHPVIGGSNDRDASHGHQPQELSP